MNTPNHHRRAQPFSRRSPAGVSVGLGLAAALLAAVLAGCAGNAAAKPGGPEGVVSIAITDRTAYFNAAREVLLERRLVLERVDPELGVITTRPTEDALASGEDLLNRQLRQVRVEFPSAAGADGQSAPMQVRVIVYRVQEPGWRPSPTSVTLSTRTVDPALVRRELSPRSVSPLREDTSASQALAEAISRRVQSSSAPKN